MLRFIRWLMMDDDVGRTSTEGGRSGEPDQVGDAKTTLEDLPTVVAEEFSGWVPEWAREEPPEAAPGSTNTITVLEPVERRLLEAVVKQPGGPSSRYPKLAGTSHRKALKVRKRLVELGFLREEQVNTKARGRASIILTPTDRAVEFLQPNPSQQDDEVNQP